MSKRLAQIKKGKSLLEKVKPGNFLKIRIPAAKASAAPPLAQFCKEFNQKTENIKDGVPVCCSIKINPDRTFSLTIHPPTSTYFILSAAGITRGAMRPELESCGMLSLKHIYEIAKLKISDPNLEGISMEKMCTLLLNTCRSIGVKVVPKLDVNEYKTFLEERSKVVESQLKELQDKKQAKLLRTIT